MFERQGDEMVGALGGWGGNPVNALQESERPVWRSLKTSNEGRTGKPTAECQPGGGSIQSPRLLRR